MVASKPDLEESVDTILDQLNMVIPCGSASVQLLEEMSFSSCSPILSCRTWWGSPSACGLVRSGLPIHWRRESCP